MDRYYWHEEKPQTTVKVLSEAAKTVLTAIRELDTEDKVEVLKYLRENKDAVLLR